MHLHYLVKLKIRVFCVNSNAGKSKTQEILLIDFDFTYWKRHNLLTLTSCYGKFNQENMYQTLLELESFCKRYDKNILVCFSVHSSNCCSFANRECKVSQGRVDTIIKWGGKRLHFCITNLLRTICTKVYYNRSGFVNCTSKNILVRAVPNTVISLFGRIPNI